MTAQVINLRGEDVGENFAVHPDTVLEAAKGELLEVVVVGIQRDGQTFLAGSKGTMNTLWLLEAGKWALMRLSETD